MRDCDDLLCCLAESGCSAGSDQDFAEEFLDGLGFGHDAQDLCGLEIAVACDCVPFSLDHELEHVVLCADDIYLVVLVISDACFCNCLVDDIVYCCDE